MNSKKKPHAMWHAGGIALALIGLSAHGAEPSDADAPAASPTPTQAEASAETAAPAEPTAADPPPPTTRLRFSRGTLKPGIETLRVVRREDTAQVVVGQIAVNLLMGGKGFSVSTFSKGDLAGTVLDELKDDPVAVNPALSDLNDALSKVATDIYRKRAEAARATALTDGSTPEEIEEASQVQKEADTPLISMAWHLVYENFTGSDQMFKLRYGAQLGQPGFLRPPLECAYESEPVEWAQWQADHWQHLRDERAKAVARCTETLAAAPEKRW